MSDLKQFSPRLAEILRDAYRTVSYLPTGQRRKLYNQWRVTMGTIAPVDSFYVAFFRDDEYLVLPYIFDTPSEQPPGHQTYGPDRLAAWIKKNAKPYLYSMDDGRLLHRGHSFGDEERLSRDAIAVPLLEASFDGPAVIGLASMQSYQPRVYSEEIAGAFQWLAESVVRALAREREDVAHETRLLGGGDATAGPMSVVDVVEAFGHRLEELRRDIIRMTGNNLSDPEAVLGGLSGLRDLCERTQSEMNELLMRPSVEARLLLDKLTAREQEVAFLMADGLTNEEVADDLGISVATVKTHVTRVLDKFGVRQRAAVVARLRPYG
ncbi:LuxR C-terminal-related transcriptional regulator [Kribbella sp. NPDC058245]|uniref:helix-turn-helix transcriptional regulator n=1 Tax=Kribbella sp. NPDC058245 TaxID=3346399 RepID=UPI0036E362C6